MGFFIEEYYLLEKEDRPISIFIKEIRPSLIEESYFIGIIHYLGLFSKEYHLVKKDRPVRKREARGDTPETTTVERILLFDEPPFLVFNSKPQFIDPELIEAIN